jgi:hypothetical protein
VAQIAPGTYAVCENVEPHRTFGRKEFSRCYLFGAKSIPYHNKFQYPPCSTNIPMVIEPFLYRSATRRKKCFFHRSGRNNVSIRQLPIQAREKRKRFTSWRVSYPKFITSGVAFHERVVSKLCKGRCVVTDQFFATKINESVSKSFRTDPP